MTDDYTRQGYFSVNDTANDVLDEPAARTVLERYVPALVKVMTEQNSIPLGLSIKSILSYGNNPAEAADRGVTLVKDTRGLLPIDTKEKNRALLIYMRSTPNSKGDSGDGVRERIAQELTRVGFTVTQCPSFYDRENAEGVNPMNFVRMMMDKREDFKKKVDVVFVFINVKGYAQRNVERLSWSSGHSMELPWYTEEVPTVGVSLNYTNHLVDCANIQRLTEKDYGNENILMCGDAPGDEQAAAKNGVLYYPILVSHENESWQLFLDEALERFASGSYAGAYQEERRAAFNRNLGL